MEMRILKAPSEMWLLTCGLMLEVSGPPWPHLRNGNNNTVCAGGRGCSRQALEAPSLSYQLFPDVPCHREAGPPHLGERT